MKRAKSVTMASFRVYWPVGPNRWALALARSLPILTNNAGLEPVPFRVGTALSPPRPARHKIAKKRWALNCAEGANATWTGP